MKISDLKNYTVLPNISVPTLEPKKSKTQKVLDVGTSVSNFFGGKGISDLAGAAIAKAKAKPEEKQFVEFPKAKEVAGSAIQLGANFLPGAGIGAKLGTKALVGAGTGLAFDVGSKLQRGETPTPGVGTAVGATLPVAGAVIGLGTKIVGRLLKGLGSGLSGVSTKTIDSIVQNPKVAQQATQKLATSGNSKVLEQNAKTIINGVSKIRKEASSQFAKGLNSLSKSDINPQNIKNEITKVLESNKINVIDNNFSVENADFLDQKIRDKAISLVKLVNNQKDLSGTGVRKLIDIIDNNKFKTAPDGDRQAFNALANDIKNGLKKAVSQSTNKLDKINARYSSDLQLTETVEDIFGSVNFKNLPEVVKASQKLEGLFAQKGLAPDVVDDFLKRIGVSSADFRTGEAIRQISNKQGQANTKGLSVGESVQQITSAVVTPQLVRDISIKTGIADKVLAPLLNSLKSLSPALQKTLIQALLANQQ